jgi:DNA-binding MarR family transcriptional regulator
LFKIQELVSYSRCMNTAPVSAPGSATESVPGSVSESAPGPAPTRTHRWLTAEEQQVWRSYVHATTLLEDHLDRQLQRDAGMPHIYYGLLVKLAEAPRRRLRMTELAMHAKITRSRLSHAVARLEKNGWVRREDCPSDKRGQFAVLTDEGHEVLRRTAPGHVAAVRQALFDRLTPQQQKSLGEIMEIIAEGLQPNEAGADLPWLR